MVKDAFSENGSGLPPAADGLIPQTQSESAQAPAANLTELAQLLAASIAQSQAGKGRTGIPTNADLTSLANLVSAAQGQRTLAPVFKDGLSSLSYSQARPAQGAAQAPLDIGHHHDDEPMPIPSTWRQPMAHDEEGWLRQQMGAAFVGLLAGLAIVVPTVLWLSGVFDSGKVKVAGSTRTSSPPAGTVTLDAKAAADASESSHGQSAGPPGREVRARTPVRGAICDRQRRCKAARAGAPFPCFGRLLPRSQCLRRTPLPSRRLQRPRPRRAWSSPTRASRSC